MTKELQILYNAYKEKVPHYNDIKKKLLQGKKATNTIRAQDFINHKDTFIKELQKNLHQSKMIINGAEAKRIGIEETFKLVKAEKEGELNGNTQRSLEESDNDQVKENARNTESTMEDDDLGLTMDESDNDQVKELIRNTQSTLEDDDLSGLTIAKMEPPEKEFDTINRSTGSKRKSSDTDLDEPDPKRRRLS